MTIQILSRQFGKAQSNLDLGGRCKVAIAAHPEVLAAAGRWTRTSPLSLTCDGH